MAVGKIWSEMENLFTWEGRLPETVQFTLPIEAPKKILDEWGGTGFAPLSVWGLMGRSVIRGKKEQRKEKNCYKRGEYTNGVTKKFTVW